ncbi:MAG: Uma2 family endonuclease [Bauldia sp.]|nr:Uma2 family endonuclease [Bauldia sp.]
MAEPAKRCATYADLEAVSPLLVAELIGGDLVTHRLPAPINAAAATALSSMLTGPYQKAEPASGRWIFMNKPEVHLGADVIVPDLAGWRRERLPTLPETAFMEIPPDWVCEVLSPATERFDRGPKRRIYANAGVSHLWLLDPRIRLLEVFVLEAGEWKLAATAEGSEAVSAPPFDAISFSLGLLWPFDQPEGA